MPAITLDINNGQDIINALYELEYKTRSLYGEKTPLKTIIYAARSKVQFSEGIEKLWIKVDEDGENLFVGHQGHFADTFFDNAHDYVIQAWAKDNGYTVELKMSVNDPWLED